MDAATSALVTWSAAGPPPPSGPWPAARPRSWLGGAWLLMDRWYAMPILRRAAAPGPACGRRTPATPLASARYRRSASPSRSSVASTSSASQSRNGRSLASRSSSPADAGHHPVADLVAGRLAHGLQPMRHFARQALCLQLRRQLRVERDQQVPLLRHLVPWPRARGELELVGRQRHAADLHAAVVQQPPLAGSGAPAMTAPDRACRAAARSPAAAGTASARPSPIRR